MDSWDIHGISISWDIMGLQGISWDFMEVHDNHGISWDIDGISWDIMGLQGISWDFMEFHDNHGILMGFHGIFM